MAIRNQKEQFPHDHQLQLMTKGGPDSNPSFKCDGCKERGFGKRYRCDTCNFDLHEECHHPPLTLQSHHFPPEFTFKFLPAPTMSLSCFCVACGKGVFGFVYQYSCKDKDNKPELLYLHPCCTNLKLIFPFKGADLILFDEDVPHDPELGTKPCFYCKKIALSGQGQEQGWSYLSKSPVVYRIHVYCSMEISSKHPADDQYCPHGHQLKLINGPIINAKREFFDCDGCKEKGFGLRYRCDTCNFDLHKECYQPSPTIQNSNFPGHTFDFLPQLPTTINSPRFCYACGMQVKGYVYHCKDSECGWDLHPCCNNLHPMYQFAKDRLELFLQKDEIAAHEKTRDCVKCKKTTLLGTNKGVPGWSYVSKCGVYRFHAYCLMKRVREILRERETDSLAPISRRNGNSGRGRSSNTNDEYWCSLIGSIFFLDPTELFFEFLLGTSDD